MGGFVERRLGWIVAAIAALGLALRLAAAQGGLWLDEAWSAVVAAEAGTPLGVFLNINHDNNHHLNSLWLLLVGLDAQPWLQRGLSIASGTAAIAVAAAIGAWRDARTAIAAALLFALSPILVTYGSEARGYAPMLLALLAGIWLTDRWLADPDARAPAIPLALVAFLGLLAQLTMAFGLLAIGLWAAWSLRERRFGAMAPLLRAFLPAVLAAAAALALIFLPARAAGGMTFGAMAPFTLSSWGGGLEQMAWFSFGHLLALPAALLVLALGGVRLRRDRLLVFCVIAALTAPLAVLALGLPNAGGGRYYLLTTVALLLFAAAAIGAARRAQGVVALSLLLLAMAAPDAILLADQRADPARAVAAIAARAPAGADAAVDRERSTAILAAAAASAHYPLTLRQTCPAAGFLFIERDGSEPFPAAPVHCATRYRAIAGDTVQGLSGTQWQLYERLP